MGGQWIVSGGSGPRVAAVVKGLLEGLGFFGIDLFFNMNLGKK